MSMKKESVKKHKKCVYYAMIFELLFLLFCPHTSFCQRDVADECANLKFSHFSGVYNGMPATLDVLYSKDDSIISSLFFYSAVVSRIPLGLQPVFEFVKNGVVVDEKTFLADPNGGIVDWVKFYASAKINPKSYEVDWRRYYDKAIKYRLQIVASFKDNYLLFTGMDTSNPSGKKTIFLKRDTANEYKYLTEIKHLYQLVRNKYPNGKVSLKAIDVFDDNFISGLFLFGKDKGDSSNIKAFTFLRNKGSLFDIHKSLTAKEVDSLPAYDGAALVSS